MNISYLITCGNETDTLRNLLQRVLMYREINDEIIVVRDAKYSNSSDETSRILYENLSTKADVFIYRRELGTDYSAQKNWGANQCKGTFIFQIDGDECPTVNLLLNIKDIIRSNPNVEAFWIPRINDYRGVTEQHAKHWGWRLTISPTYKRPLVNWPDFQCRCFLNVPDRIQWVGRLHERIQGNKNYVYLPPEEDLALYHDKTIEKQMETNVRYNAVFTEEENKGFVLPK